MAELPLDVIIYGFSFIDVLSEIDMSEIHETLLDKGIPLYDVIFSTWDDHDSSCTWVMASNRYMNDDEVKNTIEFIIENNIEEEYCLINFVKK